MVLEVAVLSLKKGFARDFEAAFAEAAFIIARQDGYIWHELKKCVEKNDQYLLLVQWKSLEDHTIGFRESEDYLQWKSLLHHFYEPFPIVEHYI